MQSHPEEEDDDYESAEDEDFDPQSAAAADAIESSDDESSANKTRAKRTAVGKADDLDFSNSGDEATLRNAQSSKKRKAQPDDDGDGSEDGGSGGFIKTRAQRLVETRQPKSHVGIGKATVNVDDLWAQMSSPLPLPNDLNAIAGGTETAQSDRLEAERPALPIGGTRETARTAVTESDSVTVTIKRSYDFAGKTEVEERVVPAHSAEAKLYLAEQAYKADGKQPRSAPAGPQLGLRKPMKRKSMFADTSADTSKEIHVGQGPRLNTLQKSKLDWAQQVDKEGIADELVEHSRGKDSYASRMEFLGRMDAKRGEGARDS